jgi:hypothetical protein
MRKIMIVLVSASTLALFVPASPAAGAKGKGRLIGVPFSGGIDDYYTGRNK